MIKLTFLDSSYQDLSTDVFDWFLAGPRFPIVFGNDIIMTSFLSHGFQIHVFCVT